jgi:outer membrane protein TolC
MGRLHGPATVFAIAIGLGLVTIAAGDDAAAARSAALRAASGAGAIRVAARPVAPAAYAPWQAPPNQAPSGSTQARPGPAFVPGVETPTATEANLTPPGASTELEGAAPAGGATGPGTTRPPANAAGAGQAESVPPGARFSDAPGQGILTLDEVLLSVDRSFPMLEAALFLRNVAAGDRLAAEGAWDLMLDAGEEVEALGFYRNNRAMAGLSQATWNGGYLFGGYRVGRGDIEPWYQERVTDEGGEFAAGFKAPLLRDRAIDKRRAALGKAQVGVAAAEPYIGRSRIDYLRAATEKYWKWVAAGQSYLVARNLVELARRRMQAIDDRVRVGDLPGQDQIDNQRLIAAREAKLIDADRKFRAAAVELALYLRDERGRMIVPGSARLPQFPEPRPPAPDQVQLDLEFALEMRPELRVLELTRDKYGIDLRYARNQFLPGLNVATKASQDFGPQSSSKGDKSPFELELGLFFDMPLQRRTARGQVAAIQGEIARINAQLRYARDRVSTDVILALTNLMAAHAELQRARDAVRLTDELRNIEEVRLLRGDSDVLRINLREVDLATYQLLVIEALDNYFEAEADYRAALASPLVPGAEPRALGNGAFRSEGAEAPVDVRRREGEPPAGAAPGPNGGAGANPEASRGVPLRR